MSKRILTPIMGTFVACLAAAQGVTHFATAASSYTAKEVYYIDSTKGIAPVVFKTDSIPYGLNWTFDSYTAPKKNFLYASCPLTSSIYKWDLTTQKLVTRLQLPAFSNPYDLVRLNTGIGPYLAVSCSAEGTIRVINYETMKEVNPLNPIRVGGSPLQFANSPNFDYIYVTNSRTTDVSILGPSGDSSTVLNLRGKIPVGGYSQGIFLTFNAITGLEKFVLAVALQDQEIDHSKDKDQVIFRTLNADGSVDPVASASWPVLPTGHDPYGVVFSFDGRRVLWTEQSTNVIQEYSFPNLQFTRAYQSPGQPRGINQIYPFGPMVVANGNHRFMTQISGLNDYGKWAYIAPSPTNKVIVVPVP